MIVNLPVMRLYAWKQGVQAYMGNNLRIFLVADNVQCRIVDGWYRTQWCEDSHGDSA